MVPRWRTCGSPTVRATAGSSGHSAPSSSEASSVACRVPAPIAISSPSTRTYCPDFAEVGRHLPLEVGEVGTELWAVEDGLAGLELGEHRKQLSVGLRTGLGFHDQDEKPEVFSSGPTVCGREGGST